MVRVSSRLGIAGAPFFASIACLTLSGVLRGGEPPSLPPPAQPRPLPEAVVEVEEEVYSFQDASNGAGPLWCLGSTCLVRTADGVFASGLETIPDAKPLNNCRWTFFHRAEGGWRRDHTDPSGRTREPCPLAAFSDGRIFLSVNPTLTDPSATAGPARPEILVFQGKDPGAAYLPINPVWDGAPQFSEHSYRSFAADGRRRELLLLQNIGYTHAEWTFLDGEGKWSAKGRLVWPWGAEYDTPQPIRVCYPTVSLRDHAVHFCGVSDIVEPYKAWRDAKRQITGREWDYDFRRLFYTWTPDIAAKPFQPWIEIASRDKTCGWILPCDLWLSPDGAVHLLWLERATDERLRDKFFPGVRQTHALNHAVVREGRVEGRWTLLEGGEGLSGILPKAARFHATEDNRVFVVLFADGPGEDRKYLAENRLLEVLPNGGPGPLRKIPMARPFTSYFTATPRAGSPASDFIDLLGQQEGKPQAISYARIHLRTPESKSLSR